MFGILAICAFLASIAHLPGAFGSTLITAGANWSPRNGGYVTNLNGTFLLFGVSVADGDISIAGEIWKSIDGSSWSQLSPHIGYEPLLSSSSVTDFNNVLYIIQGTDNAYNEYPDVYRSSDVGMTWSAQHDKPGHVLLPDTRCYGTAASLADTPNSLLLFGGQDLPNDFLKDAYLSTDQGVTWTEATPSLPFGPRSMMPSGVRSIYSDFQNNTFTEVVWAIGGLSGYNSTTGDGIYHNDVWITLGYSSPIGSSWIQLTANAPFSARGGAYARMSDGGVIVVSGGTAGSDAPDQHPNDIWVSIDGGYTWGLCDEKWGFTDRSLQYTTTDQNGYLWMMGGYDNAALANVNDVWQSEGQYDNVVTAQNKCGLTVTTCPFGLACLPDSPGFSWNPTTGATCDACN